MDPATDRRLFFTGDQIPGVVTAPFGPNAPPLSIHRRFARRNEDEPGIGPTLNKTLLAALHALDRVRRSTLEDRPPSRFGVVVNITQEVDVEQHRVHVTGDLRWLDVPEVIEDVCLNPLPDVEDLTAFYSIEMPVARRDLRPLAPEQLADLAAGPHRLDRLFPVFSGTDLFAPVPDDGPVDFFELAAGPAQNAPIAIVKVFDHDDGRAVQIFGSNRFNPSYDTTIIVQDLQVWTGGNESPLYLWAKPDDPNAELLEADGWEVHDQDPCCHGNVTWRRKPALMVT